MTENVDIEALAFGGDGVGHLTDGRTIFVPGVCPGDTVRVRLIEDKERFARGRVEELLDPSPDRVTPPCEDAAAGRCGGCPWACITYDVQLRWKRQAVVDALTRIAKLDAAFVEDVVADECVSFQDRWNYRNKVEFNAGQDVAGRFTLGMHAAQGSFTPLASCHLCDKSFMHAPKALTGALRYAMGREELSIERVGLRVSRRTKDVEVALWTRAGRFPRAAVARVLTEALPTKRVGVTRILLKGEAKERKVAGTESLAGKGFWTEQVAGRTMAFSAPSFFQVNTLGAEKLIELVMEGLKPDGLDTVLDLYSGAGTFTLPLAAAAHDVIAIESAGSSVRDLRRNLEHNGLEAEVVGGDVARELADMGTVDAAVVDPPRSGLAPRALEGLLGTHANRIAYVSCDPTTLARDLRQMLVGDMYKIVSVTPVDLFPQTYHVETVCILERAK